MLSVPGLLPGLTDPPGLIVVAPEMMPDPPKTPVPLTVTVDVPKADPLVLLASSRPAVTTTPPENVLLLPVTDQVPVPSWTMPMVAPATPFVMAPVRNPLPGPRRRRLRRALFAGWLMAALMVSVPPWTTMPVSPPPEIGLTVPWIVLLPATLTNAPTVALVLTLVE